MKVDEAGRGPEKCGTPLLCVAGPPPRAWRSESPPTAPSAAATERRRCTCTLYVCAVRVGVSKPVCGAIVSYHTRNIPLITAALGPRGERATRKVNNVRRTTRATRPALWAGLCSCALQSARQTPDLQTSFDSIRVARHIDRPLSSVERMVECPSRRSTVAYSRAYFRLITLYSRTAGARRRPYKCRVYERT